jgi:hypothetical protein
MPKWIEERAEHLLARNPEMKKDTAWAIATQQSHALGKTPKGYGTPEGKREAKVKYDTPSDDVKKANPGNLESPKMAQAETEGQRLYKTLKGQETMSEPKDTPSASIKAAAMRQELESIAKEAGIGSFLSGLLPTAGGAVKSLPTGALKAQGVMTQMAKGRNFGGAAVDPFVRMRQQHAQLAKAAGVLLPPPAQ